MRDFHIRELMRKEAFILKSAILHSSGEGSREWTI
jgi:hypothetical protein